MTPFDQQHPGTSIVAGLANAAKAPILIVTMGTMAFSGTAAQDPSAKDIAQWRQADIATAGLGQRSSAQATSAAISELRRLTGLTWSQLAGVVGTSRRSLHLWASGSKMNANNEVNLGRILVAIKQIDRGTAKANRELLLCDHDGELPIDLLSSNNKQELTRLVELVGPSPKNARQILARIPLSREAQLARKPISPAQQLDAKHESVHISKGPRRALYPSRIPRRKK